MERTQLKQFFSCFRPNIPLLHHSIIPLSHSIIPFSKVYDLVHGHDDSFWIGEMIVFRFRERDWNIKTRDPFDGRLK